MISRDQRGAWTEVAGLDQVPRMPTSATSSDTDGLLLGR
jgi:hypothetical protein